MVVFHPFAEDFGPQVALVWVAGRLVWLGGWRDTMFACVGPGVAEYDQRSRGMGPYLLEAD